MRRFASSHPKTSEDGWEDESEDGWEDEPRAPRAPRADGQMTARILCARSRDHPSSDHPLGHIATRKGRIRPQIHSFRVKEIKDFVNH